jgi:hypothetical protein
MSKIETFSAWAPFDILKSNPNGGDAEPMVGRIGGIISAETVDQQGEVLSQTGMDWDYFLSKGWFNYEHMSGAENVLGHPERISSTTYKGKPATQVEGVLYLHKPKAKEIYETAVAMKKAGGNRQLGFSVEGQVKYRKGKQIVKARVLNVAITAHPVHPDARLEVLAKSAEVGYQIPSSPSAGSISPLVPQHLEAVPAIASYGTYAYKRKRMSTHDLALQLTTTFPVLTYARALSIAVEIARAVK